MSLFLFSHVCLITLFFFFKQKTAYEMRISDWSSDVCSSDLCRTASVSSAVGRPSFCISQNGLPCSIAPVCLLSPRRRTRAPVSWLICNIRCACRLPSWPASRSEEHTSELQSLMRISYDVFCLKKTKYTIQTNQHTRSRHNKS